MTTANVSTLPANGPAKRKQLSDQLDRLDTIIDALADALPQAVADACREGARQAVKDAVLEILANEQLRGLLAGFAQPNASQPAVPPQPAEPGPWARLKMVLRLAKEQAAARYRAVSAAVASAVRTLTAVVPPRRVLAVGVGVGVAVGIVSFVCPHAVSAVLGGVGWGCSAAAAQVWVRARQMMRGFGLIAVI